LLAFSDIPFSIIPRGSFTIVGIMKRGKLVGGGKEAEMTEKGSK